MAVTHRTGTRPHDANHTTCQPQNPSQGHLITDLSFHLRTRLPHNFRCQYKRFQCFFLGEAAQKILSHATRVRSQEETHFISVPHCPMSVGLLPPAPHRIPYERTTKELHST